MPGAKLKIAATRTLLDCVEQIEIAYQPIVSLTSLRAHGFEALARLPHDAPYANVLDLLDASADAGNLRLTERALLTKSISKFARFSGATDARLFCNVDNRIFDDAKLRPELIIELVKKCGLKPANLCLELSERHPPGSMAALTRIVDVFLRHNIRIALDDFGQGFSGLNTLLQISPQYVKIDRAFVSGLASSAKQQAIVAKVVALAHSLGYLAVGEGIETEADFRALRAVGCDLGQGYIFAKPEINLLQLRANYETVTASPASSAGIPARVADLMIKVEPLQITDPLIKVVERFKQGEAVDFIPVVDRHDYVHGAIYETDLRYLLFGEYGTALLKNKGCDHNIEPFIRRCPISEANAPQDALIDSYVVAESNDGVVLTLDGRYVGVLRNHAILRMAAERDVAIARDQNALTFLPGNNSIMQHLDEVLDSSHERTVVFFDFDHFKAFNDTFGFATGDRALRMFAEDLLKFRHSHDAFVGHVGGDDFFASIPADGATSEALVRTLAANFRTDAESLYRAEDRTRGGLWISDRYGEQRFVPLLRASAALVPLPASRSHIRSNDVVAELAEGKRIAKQSPDGVVVRSLPETAVARHLVDLDNLVAATAA